MRACEADRCEHGATVEGRWCPRHAYPTTMEPTVVVDGAPEYALEADTVALRNWTRAERDVTEAGARLRGARNLRLAVLVAMRESGMSLADIAEVTGLTRQRIGQLLGKGR